MVISAFFYEIIKKIITCRVIEQTKQKIIEK